ncbi:MAG: tetratricopeptide repeat protein [Nitrospiraceae bacterium]
MAGLTSKALVFSVRAALLIVVTQALPACQTGKQVLVTVVHPPPIAFDGIREVEIQEFQGPADCAKGLKPKLETRVTKGKLFTLAVPGLSEPMETLTVKGTVTACSLGMGHGTMNAVVAAWHMGNQVHQEVLNEQTNRPGAPSNEVRDVLVERVAERFAKTILPTERKELRTFLPVGGDNDAGVTAATMGNWSFAIDTFGKQIKEQPKEHRAWYNRGISYEATGQFKLAVKDYRQAVELDRRDLYVEALTRADKSLQSQKTIELLKKNAE